MHPIGCERNGQAAWAKDAMSCIWKQMLGSGGKIESLDPHRGFRHLFWGVLGWACWLVKCENPVNVQNEAGLPRPISEAAGSVAVAGPMLEQRTMLLCSNQVTCLRCTGRVHNLTESSLFQMRATRAWAALINALSVMPMMMKREV